MNKRIVIIGAGGHGKVVADIARFNYEEICFLDDSATQECLGYPVVGKSSDYKGYIEDSDFFVAIGNANVRKKIIDQLEAENGKIATLIHPNAVIAKEVTIGVGSVVMAGAVINPDSQIGKGCIINTCASVDHDCMIGDYVHVSVGAHVAGTVKIGEKVWIGAGATVINNIEIIRDCMIGAGAVVVNDILCVGVYIGVPAKEIRR